MNKVVIIAEEHCIGCGKCVKLCPKRILFIDEASQKCLVTDEAKCDRLRGCMSVCPVKAITIK